MNAEFFLNLLLGAGGIGGVLSVFLTHKAQNRKTDAEIIDNIIQRLTDEISRLDAIRKELEELVLQKDDEIRLKEETINKLMRSKGELELLVRKLQMELGEK